VERLAIREVREVPEMLEIPEIPVPPVFLSAVLLVAVAIVQTMRLLEIPQQAPLLQPQEALVVLVVLVFKLVIAAPQVMAASQVLQQITNFSVAMVEMLEVVMQTVADTF
jgi:hypothetical protein